MKHADVFARAHAGHATCLADPWLHRPCPPPHAPLVWSRRNGPWREVDVLLVGAAPGNAGGRGSGDMGAHATRIPFGGDIAGANLDVLLASAGLDRDDVFIVAALNRLPDAGGGEPTRAEMAEPVGDYPSSLHLLRDTMLAAHPRLLVVLGNVGLRATVAAARLEEESPRDGRAASSAPAMPTLARLRAAGLERGGTLPWPDAFRPDASFLDDWGARPMPRLLWLTHPSAQNMSPHARVETAFHTRMLEARDALRGAVADVLGREVPRDRPDVPDGSAAAPGARRAPGTAAAHEPSSIYELPEWRDAVGPRHARLDRLWRSRGV